MSHVRRRVLHRAGFLTVVLVASLGCSTFDTTRVPADDLTLGQEIVRTFCERMAADAFPNDVSGLRWKPVCRAQVAPPDDAPPRLVALMANRDRLARALDAVMPESTHDDLGLFLGDMLPFYDPPRERLPTDTRRIAALLENISSDDDAIAALARIGTRTGYRPLRYGLGLIRPILAYPEFDHFAQAAMHALIDLPDDLPGGTGDGLAAGELTNVEAALSLYLASLAPADPLPAGEQSTLTLTRNLLFTTDPEFGSAASTERYVLVRDDRGIALPAGGVISAPFADRDMDGRADVDDLGRFVDDTGALLAIAHPFRIRHESPSVSRDANGLALGTDGLPIYEYLNGDQTMLAGVVRESVPWFGGAHPVVLDLTHGLPSLLGTPGPQTHRYGMATLSYPGFDTTNSSAVDVVYGLSSIMALSQTEPLLESVEVLMRSHEADAAAVVDSAHYLLDRSDMYPDAQMMQPNNFWDDLTEVAVNFSHEPGMLEGVIRSFADPRSAQLGHVYAGLMRYRDEVTYNPADVNGPPIGLPLDQPVDRTRPDVEGNESLFERSIALIDALNGVQVCNREGAVLHLSLGPISVRWPLFGSYRRCELLQIDNVAEAYALSILGRYQLPLGDAALNDLIRILSGLGVNVDAILESSSGIRGLTQHPTPQALNRLVFWGTQNRPDGSPNSQFVHDLMEPVVDRHGRDVVATYHGTIFAWEQPGFYEGMTPLLEVLHDPRYENAGGEYAFGALLGALYSHWPTRQHWHTSRSPGSPDFNYQDDGRSYEELVADGFDDAPGYGALVRHLNQASITLDGLSIGGRDGLQILAAAAEQIIDPARNAGLTTRSGATTVMANDGSRTMGVSPLQVLLEGLRHVDRDWAAADPDRGEAFHRARNAITLQLLDTQPSGTSFQFVNRRGRALTLALLPFLRGRLTDHRTRGDLAMWSHDLPNDTADTIAGPIVGGLVNLLDRIQGDPEARDALIALLAYVVDEASANEAFLATLYAGVDVLQVFGDDTDIVPLAHALAGALAPNARDLALGRATGAPNVSEGVASDALGLVRELQGIDTRHVLPTLLANLVAFPTGSDEAPLETILDVMSEVNRAHPGAGGDYDVPDYHEALSQTTGFMLDERRGMERLYQVVQNRVCFHEQNTTCPAAGATMTGTPTSELCGGGSCECVTSADGSLRWNCDINH
jgi:hypothetical protein